MAISACGDQAIQEMMKVSISWIRQANLAGCSAPLSVTVTQFEEMLCLLVSDAKRGNPKIIAADFNEWTVDWENRTTNSRGYILLEASAELDLVLAYIGNISTFWGTGSISIVDLICESAALARRMVRFVSVYYAHRHHQENFFHIENKPCSSVRSRWVRNQHWSIKNVEGDAFIEILLGDHNQI